MWIEKQIERLLKKNSPNEDYRNAMAENEEPFRLPIDSENLKMFLEFINTNKSENKSYTKNLVIW